PTPPASATTSTRPAARRTGPPPRAWAIWSPPTSTAYSGNPDPGQQISITRLVSDGGSGLVAGGRFAYRARRGEVYLSPLSILKITGVFVARLTTASSCP